MLQRFIQFHSQVEQFQMHVMELQTILMDYASVLLLWQTSPVMMAVWLGQMTV